MDGYQLYKIVQKNGRLKGSILGIVSFDRIPKTMMNNYMVIFNNEPSFKPGSHWLALYKRSKKVYEFFDSFGLPPAFYQLTKKHPFLKDCKIICQNKQLQSISSNLCGLYCIYYLQLRIRGHNMNDIVNHFGSNCKINDAIIMNHF